MVLNHDHPKSKIPVEAWNDKRGHKGIGDDGEVNGMKKIRYRVNMEKNINGIDIIGGIATIFGILINNVGVVLLGLFVLLVNREIIKEEDSK